MTDSTIPNLRVLAIDGGGIRGVVPVKVLMALKKQTGKEPYELFDMICGTSTGGIIAIMVGLLKIPVEKCFEIYKIIGPEIFSGGVLQTVWDLAVNQQTPPSQRSQALEDRMKKYIRECLGSENVKMLDVPPKSGESPTPRVFVISKRREVGGGIPYLFRNYDDTDDHGNMGTNDVEIWKAARATSAAPTYISPVNINGVEYEDGGLGHNNPAVDALSELGRIIPWMDRKLRILVSLGTGTSNVCYSQNSSWLPKHLQFFNAYYITYLKLVQLATDCEKTHEQVAQRFAFQKKYARLDPDGIGDFGLDEADKIGVIIQNIERYLSKLEQKEKLQDISNALQPRRKRILYSLKKELSQNVHLQIETYATTIGWKLRQAGYLPTNKEILHHYILTSESSRLPSNVTGVILLTEGDHCDIHVGKETVDNWFEPKDWTKNEFRQFADAVVNLACVIAMTPPGKRSPDVGLLSVDNGSTNEIRVTVIRDAYIQSEHTVNLPSVANINGKGCAEVGAIVWKEVIRVIGENGQELRELPENQDPEAP